MHVSLTLFSFLVAFRMGILLPAVTPGFFPLGKGIVFSRDVRSCAAAARRVGSGEERDGGKEAAGGEAHKRRVGFLWWIPEPGRSPASGF